MDSGDLSYLKGEGEEMIPEGPCFYYVDKWAKEWPDKEAFVFRPSETEREAINYKDLRTSTENLAVWFRREFGLTSGDRVGILSVNRLSYALCEFALARLGVVLVRIFASMDSKDELTTSLKFTDCRLFLCQHASLPSAAAILPLESHDRRKRLTAPNLPKLEHVICLTGEDSPGTTPLPDWRTVSVSDEERAELYKIQANVKLTDDAAIYRTSGSTGVPKFVVHTQYGMMSYMPQLMKRAGYRSEDRYFSDRPQAHLGGNVMGVLQFGGTMIIANAWKTISGEPSDYLLTIFKEEGVNCGVSFSYLLYDLVKGNKLKDMVKNYRFFLFGGQATNAEIIRKVNEGLDAPLCAGYGSTEMTAICCTEPDDPLDVLQKYVGKPVPGYEVKIADPETRKTLPRGQIGTIAMKGPHTWYYLKNEERMRATHDEDGFFYQGDVARISEDGYLEILGREDDMMSVGTIKVYPADVEHKLCTHPAVDKAIVFGVSDQRLHEVIGAVVQPKRGMTVTSQEIIQFFLDSVNKDDLTTGSTAAPKFVWVKDSLPFSATGKVDKKALKAECLKTLNLN